jgi:hypothetical protein
LKCNHFDDDYGYGYEDANRAWVKWTNTSASASYACTALEDAERAWGIWTDAGTSATTSITWGRWVQDAQRAAIANMAYAVSSQQRAPIETAAQRLARETAEVKRAAEQKAEAERRVKAQRRAKRLLQDCLTKDQRESYEKHGFFDVVVQGKTYRIRQGTHGNVKLLGADKEGKVREVRSFCIQPGGVPDEDAMLSQKLLLEANEGEFLRIANARDIAN